MVALRNTLDLSIGEMESLVTSRLEGDVTRLGIAGQSVMKRLGWSTPTLLQHILDLELRTVGIAESEHSGTVEGLTGIFEVPSRQLARPDAGRCRGGRPELPATDGGGLRADAEGKAVRGRGHARRRADARPTGRGRYLPELARLGSRFRIPGALPPLLRSLLDTAGTLSRRDVAILSVCAPAETPASLLMCRRLGFRQSAMLEGAPRTLPVLEVDFRALQSHRAPTGLVAPRVPAIG